VNTDICLGYIMFSYIDFVLFAIVSNMSTVLVIHFIRVSTD